jgi:hypothetical protein
MQFDMFAGTPERTPLDDAIQDLRLDINRYLAMGGGYVSWEALDLLASVEAGAASLPKKIIPYALVHELRRHKFATFTYEGKHVHVRLNQARISEMANEAVQRTEAFAAA